MAKICAAREAKFLEPASLSAVCRLLLGVAGGHMLTRFRIISVSLALALAALAGTRFAHAEPTPIKTVVLVHGAFADGSSWDKVAAKLQAKGLKTIAVHQPLSSLADDVAATKRAVEQAEGPVLLVGHSYGGVVISEAGNHEKVAALVYVAAFAPDQGESINSLGKGAPPPPWASTLRVDSAGYGWLPEATVIESFAQDLPLAERKLVASKQAPIALKSFDGTVTHPAWASKPSYYVLTAKDHMIEPKAQDAMSKRMKASVTTLQSSHVPMLSQPDKVVGVILSAAKGAQPALAAAR
jgi:pimeloyl-ACP methyl ester carboxylesterase